MASIHPEIAAVQERERMRVRPQFSSAHYGTPTHGQSDETYAEEFKRGADDQSEKCIFYDLYQPQRASKPHSRLEEYTPAGMDLGIFLAS